MISMRFVPLCMLVLVACGTAAPAPTARPTDPPKPAATTAPAAKSTGGTQ